MKHFQEIEERYNIAQVSQSKHRVAKTSALSAYRYNQDLASDFTVTEIPCLGLVIPEEDLSQMVKDLHDYHQLKRLMRTNRGMAEEYSKALMWSNLCES